MIRTQVQLSEHQYSSLKELAGKENVSISELVHRGVDLLVKSAYGPSEPERRANALAVLGRFSDDTSDVAEHHDRYLAEAFEH